jgi:PAS domain S-box-containing protein
MPKRGVANLDRKPALGRQLVARQEDQPPDDSQAMFERWSRIAAATLQASCAAIALAAPNGGWQIFSAQLPADIARTLAPAYAHTLAAAEPVLVADLRAADCPGLQSAAAAGLAYAGSALADAAGASIGVLVVLDQSPRAWGAAETALLRDLAAAIGSDLVALARSAALEQARQQQAETLATLETLLANAPIGFAFFDREHRYVRLNETLAAINGLPIEAHLGRPITELLPSIGASVASIIDAVFASGQPLENLDVSGETPAAPGATRSWLVGFYPVRSGSEVIYVGGVVMDITARKHMEEALRLGEAGLRTLVNALPQLIWRLTNAGEVDFLNDQLLHYIGLDQITRDPLLEAAHADDLPAVRAIQQHSMAAGEPFSVECRLRRADGRYIWHIVRVVPLRDSAGAIASWFGAATDIHERKLETQTLTFLSRASAALSFSLDTQATLQLVGDLLVPQIADYATVHLLEGGAYHQALAVHADPHQQRMLRELGESMPIPAALLGLADPSGGISSAAMLFADASGADALSAMPIAALQDLHRRLSPTSCMIVPLVARGQVRGILSIGLTTLGGHYGESDTVIAQELGLRVAGALDNARLYQEAQEAVREREALLSVASHELKNPLTSLLGYTNLLERRVVAGAILGERELKHIRMIREQGARLSKMLDLLLDLARLDSGQFVIQPAIVDMGGVIERILTEIDATLSIHTILYYEPETPAILQGDELRLEQVVRNLLSNAIKYSPDGGEITVRLETHAERVVLSIEDRGLGIPAAALPRIFQRFSRVGGTTISGLGVGLYVVREIIALHGGAVEVVSEEGAGSTFIVTLPACPNGGS